MEYRRNFSKGEMPYFSRAKKKGKKKEKPYIPRENLSPMRSFFSSCPSPRLINIVERGRNEAEENGRYSAKVSRAEKRRGTFNKAYVINLLKQHCC